MITIRGHEIERDPNYDRGDVAIDEVRLDTREDYAVAYGALRAWMGRRDDHVEPVATAIRSHPEHFPTSRISIPPSEVPGDRSLLGLHCVALLQRLSLTAEQAGADGVVVGRDQYASIFGRAIAYGLAFAWRADPHDGNLPSNFVALDITPQAPPVA